ncbi:MAG: CatB-related O-acetyltransferase [Pseudomonadota bacterium]
MTRTLGPQTPQDTPGSIFLPQELASLYNLKDPLAIEAGHIRGPTKLWTIKGNVLCGRYTSINGQFNARGRIRIGNYCAFGRLISLISTNHRTDMPNQQLWLSTRHGFEPPSTSKGPTEIGHNVWIGDKANILSGVQVGHGSVIAAGTTVTKSVGPFEIVAGSPARMIRKRFTDSVIEQLLEIAWWRWADDTIARNRIFFETAIPPDQDIDLHALVVR